MKFTWPLDDHYITRGFSYKSDIYIGGMHAGLDLVRVGGDTAGRPIKAVAMGVVVETAWDKYSGYYVVLDHDGGWRSKYRHMVGTSPLSVGQPVVQGQAVGNVGSTGLSTGPHLHFDLWHRQKQDNTAFYKQGWWAHDPELYLGRVEPEPEEEEDDMQLLFYRYKKTGAIHAIGPDAKGRRITLVEWKAHKVAGATYIDMDENPAKIKRA